MTKLGRTRRIARAGLVMLSTSGLVSPPAADAWSLEAHQSVAREAIDLLPKELKKFFEDHRVEMPTLAVDASPLEEGLDHRFLADRIVPFPFLDLPRSEEALKREFPEAASEVGRLPWLVNEAYDDLVEAFRSGDKGAVLVRADRIAWLVTDLHNPLAVTRNSDGQLTGQEGLWERVSVRLPTAVKDDLDLDGDAAHYLDHPKQHVFSMINASYIWVDNVLYHEELAARGRRGYAELYYSDLGARLRPILGRLLSDASTDVSSYWYTAWTEAGRPGIR